MRPTTAPRPASQAGETQAHVGAPLTRHELVEASPRRGALILSLDVTPLSLRQPSLLLLASSLY